MFFLPDLLEVEIIFYWVFCKCSQISLDLPVNLIDEGSVFPGRDGLWEIVQWKVSLLSPA